MGGTWRTLLPSAWSLGRAGSPLLSLQLLQQQTCRKGVPGTLPTAAGLLPLVVAGRLRAPVDVRRFRACGEQRAPAGQRIAFDTLKLVRVFEASEFTPKQAEALSSALSQIIADALAYNTEVVATKAEFSALKSEMQILEKADFAVLRSDLQLVEKKVETFMAQIYTELERIENRASKRMPPEDRSLKFYSNKESFPASKSTRVLNQFLLHGIQPPPVSKLGQNLFANSWLVVCSRQIRSRFGVCVVK
jgi:hypothetical protein